MGRESDLLVAAQSGNVGQIERILQNKRGTLASFRKGVNPNCQDESGSTPLHHATLNGHKDAVELLLDYNASNCIPDSSGTYPLHLAAWSGNADITRLLIYRGPSKANVNEQNGRGDTALHSAAQYGHTSVVSLLLQAGADASVRNHQEEMPLDLAAQYDKQECAKLLLTHDPDLVKKNSKKHSPLHLAARNGHADMVLLLVQSKMDVNVVTEKGSCLHEAALFEKTEVVERLLKSGINVNIRDSMRYTALDLVSDHKSDRAKKIIEILKMSSELQQVKRMSEVAERLIDVSGSAQLPESKSYDTLAPAALTSPDNPFGPIPPGMPTSDAFHDYALLGQVFTPKPESTLESRVRTQSLPATSAPPLPRKKKRPVFDFIPDVAPRCQTFASVPRSHRQDTPPFNSADDPAYLAQVPPTPAFPPPTAEHSATVVHDTLAVEPQVPLSSQEKGLAPPKPPRDHSYELESEPSEEETDVDEEEDGSLDEEADVLGELEWVVSPTNPFAGLQITGSMDEEQVAVVNERISQIFLDKKEVSGLEETKESVEADDWDKIEELLEAVEEIKESLVDMEESSLEKAKTSSLSKSLEELADLPSPSSQPESIQEWLEDTLGLPQYADLLVMNGFDDLRFLANGILEENDLLLIGVEHADDREAIMSGMEFLPIQYKTHLPTAATSLGYWLESLKLTQYTAVFIQRGFTSMGLVANLLGVSNIETVLPICPLGHQKRLKASIDALFGIKVPTAPPRVDLKSSPSVDQSIEELLREAEKPHLAMLEVDFARDYSQIKSTASPQVDRRQPTVETEAFGKQDPEEMFHGKEKSPERSVGRTRRKSSDVPMLRPPQQAQLESRKSKGLKEESHFTKAETWRHPARILLKGNINYVSKYLGSMLVEKVMGIQSTMEACIKMRGSTRKMKKIPFIVLAISAHGIKFIDAQSKNVIQEHKIQSISYCSQDREDLKTFAYINKDSLIGKHYCHVFSAQNPEIADEIILTLGQAFEVAYQKALKYRARKEAEKFEQELEMSRAEKERGSMPELSALGLGPAADPDADQ